MTDQYKEQYKKETEQIHAPADLIAKTKAAVREEEARIQRKRAVKTARRWAYPMTVVAAIVILTSVSLMMRGLEKSGSDRAAYESAADSGAAESATEETFDEALPEDALVAEEAPAEVAEGSTFDGEAAFAESEEFAEDDREAASAAPATGGMEEFSGETKRDAASGELSPETGDIEDAMSQKREEKLANSAAEGITIRKVRNKPAFVNRADTELQTYEDMVFQVMEDGDGWVAYVESDNGGGYVIRGEAETMEAFLEAGYQRVLEIDF